MKHDEATQLESDFAVTFPAAYREAITGLQISADSEELDTDAESLRISNEGCRREAPWGFSWKPHYWLIGADGAGGFYFLDTLEDDSTVYYCDHEDMPESITDLDRLRVIAFQDFVERIQRSEVEFRDWDRQIRDRAQNRQWWQFWIPRN